MKPASQDNLAICSAILPLIKAWQDLDSAADVLSLDADPSGLDGLLAAQRITLRQSIDEIDDDWSVVTKLDACDVLSPDDLKAWTSETLHRLKPGGLLVLGGTGPEHTAFHSGDTYASPEAVKQITHDAGFARAHVISPDFNPSDSLYSALYGASRRFAVVAQKHAFGKAFDVFSPGFLKISSLSASRRFQHAEEELHGRIAHMQSALIRAQASLRNQVEESAHLHNELEALRAKLKRATRRRGLRKLAYEIKTKLKPRSDFQSPSETAPPTSAPEKTTSVRVTQRTDRLAQPTIQVPVDPVPLSAHEITLRSRLFDEQKT